MKKAETYAESNKILKDILKFPKEEVIPLLMEEFRVYTDECKNDIFPENDIFAIQSLIIFTEFGAEESLDLILSYLSLSYYILSYQLASFFVENTWEVIYRLCENRIEEVEKFVVNKEIDLVVRNCFFRALAYLTYIGKKSKESTVELFLKLMNDNKEFIDLKYYLVCDMRSLQVKELEETIKKVELEYYRSNTPREQLMEFEYINFEEYQKNIKPLTRVVERYEQDEREYFEELDIDDDIIDFSTAHDFDKHWRSGDDFYDMDYQEPRTSMKIGRNDLCPCGSGKKYKKCCGK